MGDRSPDVKYLEPCGGPPTVAILQVHEQMSRGDPPAKRGAPVAVTQSGRRSLYSIALGRINQLASWVHALWMAKKSADEDADVQEYYNALRSEEEDWSTTVTAAELALEDSTDFKDVPL
ncbi:hypothetical protein MRX96_019111 [Rhipicephalus microplus]